MWYEAGKFLSTKFFFSDINRVYYIIIALEKVSSHENFADMQEQSSAGVLQGRCCKKFWKFTGNHQDRSLLNEVVGRSLNLLFYWKRYFATGGNLQNFEEQFFYRTDVYDCFWIYQNMNGQKVSVSDLIISKSYREAGIIGRRKLLFPAHITIKGVL